MHEAITKETMVWNAEPQGRYNPYFISKYHLDRGDTTATCSTRVLLNTPAGDRGPGWGGPLSFGDGGQRLGNCTRDEVCAKCVPVLPSSRSIDSGGLMND